MKFGNELRKGCPRSDRTSQKGHARDACRNIIIYSNNGQHKKKCICNDVPHLKINELRRRSRALAPCASTRPTVDPQQRLIAPATHSLVASRPSTHLILLAAPDIALLPRILFSSASPSHNSACAPWLTFTSPFYIPSAPTRCRVHTLPRPAILRKHSSTTQIAGLHRPQSLPPPPANMSRNEAVSIPFESAWFLTNCILI